MSDNNGEPIRFYRATGEYGFLSNLWPCQVTVSCRFLPRTRTFASAEHAYQFFKPSKPEIAEWIASAPFPRTAAHAGHSLPTYDIREDWRDIRFEVMYDVVFAKFVGNRDLADRLLATGSSKLIEDAGTRRDPTSLRWGLTTDGKGMNHLGEILMMIRDGLRKQREGLNP